MSNKPQKVKQGITFPTLVSPDTGIHAIRSLKSTDGVRYKVWYHVDGKKRYTLLPRGIDLAEARVRRSRLYAALQKDYGGKRVKTLRKPNQNPPKEFKIKLTPRKYVYRQLPWAIVVMGRKVGEARTVLEAEAKRDEWFRKNAHKLPCGVEGVTP